MSHSGDVSVSDLKGLTEPSSAYKNKAWIAMVGLLLFVIIYLCLTMWFLLKSWSFLKGAFAGGEGAFLAGISALPALFLSAFMLKALFFVQRGGDRDLQEINLENEPELVDFIYGLADEAGAPRPHKIFLSPMVNAAVFYDISIVNFLFPSKKNLLIGLGLVNVLNRTEFKAVLAHEFGHFSQKSMAIGRWVYMSEQITSHIVNTRGALDSILSTLSRIDLRIAWIGWIMSIIVWSIRSLLETIYRLVSLTHMALSREMEYQADLVSVSLTGSDALIHALHKLQAADESWNYAINFLNSELDEKRKPKNMFAIQAEVQDYLRQILADKDYGIIPEMNTGERDKHRIFKKELAQPPQMWMTHPANSDREENAKKIYIARELDDRSAWGLFADVERTKQEVTEKMLIDMDAEFVESELSLRELKKYFDKKRYQRKYQGVYLGREVMRHLKSSSDIYQEIDVSLGISNLLKKLYPEDLSELMEQLRNVKEELVLLKAVQEKQMEVNGGVIRHRGEQLQRSDLPRVIENLFTEKTNLENKVNEHEAFCRSVFSKAADSENKWNDYHHGCCELLHYAEHSFANLNDLAGVLANVVAVVTADGNVSKAELKRLLIVAKDLHKAMAKIYRDSSTIILPDVINQKLKVKSWSEKLEDFKLPTPNENNINDWMGAIDSWIQATLSALGELKVASLDLLLETEEEIHEQYIDSTEVKKAPVAAVLPVKYDVLLEGDERELQTKLGWWDSFQTAEGPFFLIMRLAVALIVIGSLVSLGTNIGQAKLHIYNGLGTKVSVIVNEKSLDVPAYRHRAVDMDMGDYKIETVAANGNEIESFDVTVDSAYSNNVYNVASASPLIEYSVVYGSASGSDDRRLGNPRWLTSSVDHIFEAPPSQVKTSSTGTVKTALEAFGNRHPLEMLSLMNQKEQINELIRQHAIYEPETAKYTLLWFMMSSNQEGFQDVLKHRLAHNVNDVLAQRSLYETADDQEKKALIKQWKEEREIADNAVLTYLITRTTEDLQQRNQQCIENYNRYPENPWIAYAAGSTLIDRGEFKEGMRILSSVKKLMPSLREYTMLMKERIRRLETQSFSSFDENLYKQSYLLHQYVSMENEVGSIYASLNKGDLKQSLALAKKQPEKEALIKRLVAMSDGAKPMWVTEALSLPNSEDELELCLAYALKLKVGMDTSYEQAKLIELAGDEYLPVFKFLNLVIMKKRVHESLLQEVNFTTRARTYYMARYLSPLEVKDEWVSYAKYMLFASEKPYMK